MQAMWVNVGKGITILNVYLAVGLSREEKECSKPRRGEKNAIWRASRGRIMLHPAGAVTGSDIVIDGAMVSSDIFDHRGAKVGRAKGNLTKPRNAIKLTWHWRARQ
eukprot:221345-Amphidinium_carterae.3